jgi:hypothetical protein
MFESAPKMSSLDADNWVGMSVEGGVSPKDVGRNGKGLDTIGAACERLFDDVSQEFSGPIGGVEVPTPKHVLELNSYPRLVRHRGCFITRGLGGASVSHGVIPAISASIALRQSKSAYTEPQSGAIRSKRLPHGKSSVDSINSLIAIDIPWRIRVVPPRLLR